MKSIGDQVREFRLAKGLNTAQFAALVKKKRQHIEQLEAAGNRIPKYLGELATAMGTSVDQILATAGLHKPVGPMVVQNTRPKGAFLKDPTPEELELIDHFRHLLGSDRRELLKKVADLARERMAQREELLAEAGLDRIRERAAAAVGMRSTTTVDPGDPRLRQLPLIEEPKK